MEAGIVNTLWDIEDLYENVIEQENQRKSIAKYKKLGLKISEESR